MRCVLLALVVSCLSLCVSSLAAPPVTAPTTTSSTAHEGDAVLDQLQMLLGQIQEMVQSGVITEGRFTGDGVRCIQLIHNADELATQLKTIRPQNRRFADDVIRRHKAILAAMNDPQALDQLQRDALSREPTLVLASNATRLEGRWLATVPEDEAERDKTLTELASLAKANPASEKLADLVMQLSRGRVKPSQYNRLQKILRDDLKDTAASVALRKRAENAVKLAALTGKPLVIRGVRADRSAFSSEQWKGKVILVDFWATWCGPCLAELPRIKQAYASYHDKGLEVVGISCDYTLDDLDGFLAKHPEISWPQLFDVTRPGWHALASELGIDRIPTMLLIDKNGVCRSVHADEDFEQQIAKLLAE